MVRRARVWISIVAASLAIVASTSPPAQAKGVPEIAAPWLDDIAMAVTTEQGPVIFYNPTRCKQVGPAVCSFFRLHEHAHVRLNHASAYYTIVGGRALAEAEADCWAAKNAMLAQAKAAVAFFESKENVDRDVAEHGTGAERAKRVRTCRGI
jgi:hypothetical protein